MIAAPAPPLYTPRTIAGFILLVVVMVGVQSSAAFRLEFLGGKPDFLLTLALCVGLLTDCVGGAIAGFLVGLMTVAVTGSTVGTYLITRTVAAFLVSVLRQRFIRSGTLVTLFGTAVGTMIAGVLFGLSVPGIGLTRWLTATFVSALWNAIAAIPITLALRLILPRDR